MGFYVGQYVGKNQSGTNAFGKKLGYKTLIKPSSEKVREHYKQLADLIESHKTSSQTALISRLNPVIKGWTNYYATVTSSEIFSELDHKLYLKLRTWAYRRHPHKNRGWIVKKYWHTIGGDNWVFSTRENNNPLKLWQHSETKIKKHIKVKGENYPYDGNTAYWSTRMGKYPEIDPTVAKLLKRQKGKCAHCGLAFKEGDIWEKDHKVPKSKGGKHSMENLELLHRHCHDEKTRQDGSQGGRHKDKSQAIEEPCETKVSSTVLKTSGSREGVA
ncbi:RNA-directed DNA polymerase [Microseira wollei NIES-4236]|uniref:RNA-directed DNA polymerase n=1 Tax=Microseira wollei NIES-4236 TaxID=2530354 RepID=A0AAV3X8C8_9CYAN|nr:RNA-directed DNA polymerase [Microseira wollei NIES-4236]